MSETFKRGDRVIVRDVVDGTNRDYVGRVGTLRIVSPDGRYVVLMDGPGDVRIVATAVESVIETLASAQERASAQSPVAVGDRVVIRAVRNPNCERYVGRTGRVEHVFISPDLKGNYKVVLDRGFAARIIASAVEAIPERDQRELSTSERAVLNEVTPSWPATPPSELDRRRTQAAEFAHRTLGPDALLEDLIGLADWLLDNPNASPKEIKERYVSNPGGVLPSGDNAEMIESMRKSLSESLPRSRFFSMMNATDPIPVPEPTPTIPPDALEIRDKDGDRVTFSYLAGPHYFAMVEARNTDGDVCSAYITPDDADRIIAFLQDAKAARNT